MQPYYHDPAAGITIYQGDCLDVMPQLEPQSFDAIITDEPYGTTACSWDVVIPFDAMWSNIKRLVKPRAAVVLFGSQPFTSLLVASNIKWFRHEQIWRKTRASNFATADSHPLKAHENIEVFASKEMTYNPQMQSGAVYRSRTQVDRDKTVFGTFKGNNFNPNELRSARYPLSVIDIPSMRQQDRVHRTQKPLALMRYLIRTYTNPGDRVLDFTMGSGTTLEAAKIEGRRAVGIERDTDEDGNCLGYCEYAVNRLRQEVMVLL